MSNYLLTDYKSPYLKTLANNFERQTKCEGSVVLPQKQNPVCNNLQKGNKINWGYYSGVAATIGQVVAGLLMISASLLEKKCKSSQELIKKINYIGWVSLGLSYLVSIPACIGASLALKQPSMFIGSILWAIASPFMMEKKNNDIMDKIAENRAAKLKGFLMLGYAFNYLGLANKIKNEKEHRKGDTAIEYDFKGSKDNLFNKTVKFINFSLKDHITMPQAFVNAFKQTKDYVSGKRKEVPEYMSATPSSDNRKITSLLLYGGGIPLMIYGKKYKPLEKVANIMIGTGMLLDAIGLFAIGREEKGVTKAALLTGVPLRAVGDFGQTNNFMYGLRTLGGASFEYYFASLNRCEEEKKAKQEKAS